MASFVNGYDAAIPTDWPVHDFGLSTKESCFAEQPHLLTGGIQSEYYLKTRDVDWSNSNIAMTTFHGYGRLADKDENLFLVDWFLDSDTNWNGINWDFGGSNWNVERLGSRLDNNQNDQEVPRGALWEDAAAWANRMARIHYRSGYEKPMSWTEYGLESIDSGGGWHDWTTAYTADVNAQHTKDWFWGLVFSGISGCHWHPQYFRGNYGHGPHWDILKPLRDYLSDVDMRGMTHESYYSVTDPVYSNKRMSLWDNGTPSTQIDDADIGVFAMLGTTDAYLYVKNLSNTWYYAAGSPDWTSDLYLKVLTPQDRPATKIRIAGTAEGDLYDREMVYSCC